MTEGTEGYNTMKNMPNQEMNPNQTHFSQLQQMHLNNVNPMFFATGEVMQSQDKNGLLMTGGPL